MGGYKDEARLSSVLSSEQTRGNRHKLKYRKIHLNLIRKPFFMVRVTLEQVVQRGCRVSILGPDYLQGSLPTSAIP